MLTNYGSLLSIADARAVVAEGDQLGRDVAEEG